jgi:hypothetical protein
MERLVCCSLGFAESRGSRDRCDAQHIDSLGGVVHSQHVDSLGWVVHFCLPGLERILIADEVARTAKNCPEISKQWF